jgi:very-short-patch-repair endonuclease
MLDSHPATAGRYEHQASVCGYFPDFSFPHSRVIVELDGACHVGKVARRRMPAHSEVAEEGVEGD